MNKQKIKSQVPSRERERRRAEVGRVASSKIAKSKQLNFRIEENVIKELQALAHQRELPVGTMIHEWILQRLATERCGKPSTTGKELVLLGEIYEKLCNYFYSSPEEPNKMKVAEPKMSAYDKRQE